MSGSLTFKYLNLPNGLGGRGGAQRFFLLAANIPFEDQLVDLPEWGSTEKKRVLESNENPCGSLPIIYAKDLEGHPEGKELSQHIASSRYLASLYKVTEGNSAYEIYVQDLVADEYQGFRDAWVEATFSQSEEVKAKYKNEKIPKSLTVFEALYGKFKTHDVYLSVNKAGIPLWGDAAMFGLLRDNILTGNLTTEELEKYPILCAMYQEFGKIEAVKAYIDGKN